MAEPVMSNDENLPRTNPQVSESVRDSATMEQHSNAGGKAEDEVENDRDKGIIVNASDMTSDMISKKKSKKKRTKRSAGQRGLNKPTGFEDFHADAPLTPEQAEEIREAFNSDIPFVDRILKAIQRFERTRKLSPERRNVFYKYLAYGGVDVGPNMFVGAQDTTDMDKDQVTANMAQASISEDTKQSIFNPKQDQSDDVDSTNEPSKLHSPEHMAKYVIDFEGTMRSFLSRRAPAVFVFDTQDDVALVTTTLERFMDYLLQMDVCPEYKAEVLNTRDLCRTARTELWKCVQAQRQLPGNFNTACATLFVDTSISTSTSTSSNWKDTPTNPITPEEATQIIGFAIAGAATEQVYESYLEITTGNTQGQGFEITHTVSGHGFEVTAIVPPTPECQQLYREHTANFSPVGTVHARLFTNPDAPPEDLTDEERAATRPADKATEYTFFVESSPSSALDVLSLLRVGTRVEATVYTLNCGVHFFDQVLRVFPPFDLWIANEMMVGWKEPKWIEGAGAVDYARLERQDDGGDDNEDRVGIDRCATVVGVDHAEIPNGDKGVRGLHMGSTADVGVGGEGDGDDDNPY